MISGKHHRFSHHMDLHTQIQVSHGYHHLPTLSKILTNVAMIIWLILFFVIAEDTVRMFCLTTCSRNVPYMCKV